MRIAFIGQKALGVGLGGGGVDKHVGELARRLVLRGHEVVVYARRKYSSPPYHRVVDGVCIRYLPTIYTKHLDAIVHTFLSTIDVLFRRVDVINYQGVGPALLSWVPRIFRPHVTVVVTFHAQDRFHLKWGSFARMILHLGEWVSCRVPQETIVVSHGMQVLLQKQYRRHAHFIPSGASVKTVTSSAAVRALGLRSKSYLLTAGRLLPVKGLHFLIPAFRRVATDKHLVIVGRAADIRYLDELKRLAKGDGRIRFLGMKTGAVLDELFAHAYLFCQPSVSEGLPLAVLDAMSFGTAVLVSDIPGNLEAMHRAGFTFESENMDDLAAQLSYLVLHPDELAAAGTEARRVVDRYFDWDKIAEYTERVYRREHT